MRIIRYILTVVISITGMLVGVFFYSRETVYPTDLGIIRELYGHTYYDLIVISFRNYLPGYWISIALTVIFFTMLISSTTRFFFNKSPNIDNYQTDYHIRSSRFSKNTKETM